MSTTEVYLAPEEIEEFIRETLADDYLYIYGEENAELGVSPYITFYVYHSKEDFLRVSEEIIAIYGEFEKLIDEPFQLIRNPKTQNWVSPARAKDIDWHGRAQFCAQRGGKGFWLGATDRRSVLVTPRWAFMAIVDETPDQCYSTLKITFRHRWYNQNPELWHRFVSNCLNRLQPDQCYSGFEIGNGDFNILGNYEAEAMERICADYFFGMDIDHPSAMGFHYFDNENGWVNPTDLGAGLRTPVWSFLLSPNWLKRLGKTEAEVRAELDDPRISIESIPYAPSKLNPEGESALWIRLGELDLHPVERGVPDLLVKANELIRPIRCDELKLLTLDAWDDDPNQRFGYTDSLRWMRRFDEDSDWPSPEKRHPAPPSETVRLRGHPGEVVPRSGWWYTPALKGTDGFRPFEAGEHFPGTQTTEWGSVIWYWDQDKQPAE